MVIWTRWGILGILIPTVLIVLASIVAEKVAMLRLPAEARKPVKQVPVADDVEEAPPEKDPEEVQAAERKRADEDRQRVAAREKAVQRFKDTGYLIGGLVSAAVLWPLGRWMNKSETRTLVDQQSGQLVEAQLGGGHTLFFIPLEYWGFIWAAIGLFKFLGRT